MSITQLPLNPWTSDQYRSKSEELCDLLIRLQQMRNEKRDAMKAFADSIDELEVNIGFIANQIKEQSAATDYDPHKALADEVTNELDKAGILAPSSGKSIRDFTKRK